jgi:hypothetical protein
VIEVLVHADETREDAPTRQIQYRSGNREGVTAVAPTAVIRPPSITTVWSSRAGAPVPSMTRTCFKAIVSGTASAPAQASATRVQGTRRRKGMP